MSSTKTLIAIAALAALSACASPKRDDAAFAVTPIEQYPLQTEAAPEGILLAAHDYGLSQNQARVLADLADRWRHRGEGSIVIEAPDQAGPDAAATAYAARDALQDFGVPGGAIKMAGYIAPQGAAPIRVSHLTRQAKVDRCNQAWTDLSKTATNQPFANFGCAVNANIAAMIDNPADIDRPRGLDPVDAGRRQVVIDKYRQGAVTSSAEDSQARGSVSMAVQ